MSKSSKALSDIKGKTDNKSAKKETARTPLVDMRAKMRQASAPEVLTPPWEEKKEEAAMNSTAPEATPESTLASLAAIGIYPDAVTAPAATQMPEVTHTTTAPVASKEPETLDDHPLFKSIQRPSYQPEAVKQAAPGQTTHTYAGFNTPLGQTASSFQLNKPKDPPKKSTAFFASSTAPL